MREDILTQEEIEALLNNDIETEDERVSSRLYDNIINSVSVDINKIDMLSLYKDSRIRYSTSDIDRVYRDEDDNDLYYVEKLTNRDGVVSYHMMLNKDYVPVILTEDEFNKLTKLVKELDLSTTLRESLERSRVKYGMDEFMDNLSKDDE